MQEVIILSGISGSGKSTFAKEHARSVIVSADHYFIRNGIYKFDPSKLGEAHGTCFKNYIRLLQTGELTSNPRKIIVDNTCTTESEIAPYMIGAQAFGADARIITLHCDPDIAAARNGGRAPIHAVYRQFENLKARKLPPWWSNANYNTTGGAPALM